MSTRPLPYSLPPDSRKSRPIDSRKTVFVDSRIQKQFKSAYEYVRREVKPIEKDQTSAGPVRDRFNA
jgi:hypothetical protein